MAALFSRRTLAPSLAHRSIPPFANRQTQTDPRPAKALVAIEILKNIKSGKRIADLQDKVVGIFADRVEAKHEEVNNELHVAEAFTQVAQT